ncbi:hypothetical protein CT0861_13199 [Colletotrichum tofieldiae]|uniref:Uncharacterized protein n=1 Tax=Colletotrichum tofieldiae TaxID=708197 RepID=A0A166LKC6_9PEZI|nr:hypothetical protein CT0861_13199 [Colletotrichum tofieldiae]
MGRQWSSASYSLVVTDPTTNPALTGLSMGERTGSRVFLWVWSYVSDSGQKQTITSTSRGPCGVDMCKE